MTTLISQKERVLLINFFHW